MVTIEFFLNGVKKKYSDHQDISLLEYLREIEGIKSHKNGCSGQGVCGACSVHIDGRVVLSCKTKMKSLAGKNVVTIEGLRTEIQDIFAKAFVEKGGIQCGFCTPGIVMSASQLLMENLNPTIDDIKKSIHKNICRCTGYKKIIDSILYASKMLRKKNNKQLERSKGKIGERHPKYDSYRAVLGQRDFVCDMDKVGMHFGALKFSDHPRAFVKKIDITDALKVKGVKDIYTAKDIPGERFTGLIKKDWPHMIKEGEETRYIGDVLASVVAIDERTARTAVSKIKVDYEVKKPITTVDAALKKTAYPIHPEGNILSQTHLLIGDAKGAYKKSKYKANGVFYTQRVEHAFLETECCLALWESEGEKSVLKVYSQGQGAYEDRKGIASILGIPLEQVQVIQVQNGGGFGGKEDLSVQGHAAMCAYLSKVPVKIELNRIESMNMHPKRHPMRLRYYLGADEKGKLTSLIAKIDGDTGAYASVGMKVLERAAGHSAGAYIVPSVDVMARSVYTNNIPCGAMRGFGVNQAAFAMESLIDEICEKGGFDRWQIRFDNAIREGERLVTGQLMQEGDGVGLRQTLLAVKDIFKKSKYAGIACGIKNTGVGNGMPDTTQCKIVIKKKDWIQIYHGWSEMGQGVHTMALQTLCEELNVSPDMVEVLVDTKSETVCGMTTSSRGTSLVGLAIIDACKKIKDDLSRSNMEHLVGNEYIGEWKCDWTSKIGKEKEGYGHITHYSYGYATQVVTLDEKGVIKKIYAAHDAGKVMNPTLFEGQIEGAIHMGLGYALSENFAMKDGYPVNTNYGKLGIIRAKEMPEVEVIAVEAKDRHGPYGAKGVGEIGLVPTAAAVANALYTYDRKRRYSLPIGIKK